MMMKHPGLGMLGSCCHNLVNRELLETSYREGLLKGSHDF